MNKRLTLGIIVLLVAVISLFLLKYGKFLSGITGYQIMPTRLVIIKQNASACNMTFYEGWNFVSFPCLSTDAEVSFFLQNLSNYQSVRYYNPNDPTDPWKSYNPGLPSWAVQDLNRISRKGAYWITVQNTTRFYMAGLLATPSLYDLVTGWNMIGYPSWIEQSINATFGQLIPNFDYIYIYNASDPSDQWKQYTWNSSLPSDQDLNDTQIYYGYWIFMNNPDTLVIN